ncbi:MAG TPA: VWA domain-containing protein, partial [Vicinamibacterales bacterium]
VPTPTHAPTTSRQTWIFFFDLQHLTPGGGFDRAKKAVEEFIDARFREGDLAGVIAGDRMVNNRLTSLRAELQQAVRSVKPLGDKRSRDIELKREFPRFRDEQEAMEVARENREVIQRVFQRACAEGECGPSVVEQIREKGRRFAGEAQRATIATLNTINGLASGLAKMPGPKTIVFLSDGFVAETQEATLRNIVGQTARAGARVYAIDVRGLSRGMGASVDAAGSPGADSAPPAFDTLEDGVNSLAVDTGGMMIRNENNIGRALDTIAADTGTYYVLGYQPANSSFDGKYRKIEIRVKRPDLRVRARQGYLALEPAKMLIPQPIKPPGDGRKP